MSVVERFNVRADDGQTYEAIKTQSDIKFDHLSGRGRIPGLPSYQLVTGEHLNVKDEQATTFEIVTTGQIVRRV